VNLIVSDSWLGSATLPDIVMARWTRRGSDFSDVDYSGSGLFADHGAFAGRYSVGPLRLPGAVTDLKVYCAKKNASTTTWTSRLGVEGTCREYRSNGIPLWGNWQHEVFLVLPLFPIDHLSMNPSHLIAQSMTLHGCASYPFSPSSCRTAWACGTAWSFRLTS
jgi:hypothetical protein